jgi:hypothetical protein
MPRSANADLLPLEAEENNLNHSQPGCRTARKEHYKSLALDRSTSRKSVRLLRSS